LFLERFSQDSRYYPIEARPFVAELYRRWRVRNPAVSLTEHAPSVLRDAPVVSSSSGTIFISYASEDIEAAQRLCAALREMGGDITWFDKRSLKPGDDWERHMLGAIQRCSLFLPLLSANTEQRSEGYFRREWTEAAERSKKIQGRKFIFPLVIDPDYTGVMDRYALVPEPFKALQYSHAPGGQMSPELTREIQEQLRSQRRGRAL
jgi:hypothetical protein